MFATMRAVRSYAGQLWEKGAYAEAVAVLEPVVAEHPEEREAHYSLAFSLQMANERLPEAVAHFEKALELGYAEFWVRYNLGGVYLRIGELEKARQQLRRAQELEPSDPGPAALLGEVTQRALEMLSHEDPGARRAAAALVDVSAVRGYVERLWEKGETAKAVAALEPVVERHPASAEAHYSLAFSLQMAKQRLAEAVAHYERALELGYAEFWVRYNLGAAHLAMGSQSEAENELRRAAELDPSHGGPPSLLKSLEPRAARPADEEARPAPQVRASPPPNKVVYAVGYSIGYSAKIIVIVVLLGGVCALGFLHGWVETWLRLHLIMGSR